MAGPNNENQTRSISSTRSHAESRLEAPSGRKRAAVARRVAAVAGLGALACCVALAIVTDPETLRRAVFGPEFVRVEVEGQVVGYEHRGTGELWPVTVPDADTSWRGQRVSVSSGDIPIGDFLQFVADFSGLSVLLDPEYFDASNAPREAMLHSCVGLGRDHRDADLQWVFGVLAENGLQVDDVVLSRTESAYRVRYDPRGATTLPLPRGPICGSF